jgi:hypothetical protein
LKQAFDVSEVNRNESITNDYLGGLPKRTKQSVAQSCIAWCMRKSIFRKAANVPVLATPNRKVCYVASSNMRLKENLPVSA